MKMKDLDIIVGVNLRMLRRERNLTQDQLAERLRISTGLIPKWESGRKGVGKRMLLKLCRALHVKPGLFYVDERMPYIASSRERDIVYMFREAEKVGVVEMIEQFSEFMVDQAKKKIRAGNKGRPTATETSYLRRRGSISSSVQN